MGICSPEKLLYSDWMGMFSPKELLYSDWPDIFSPEELPYIHWMGICSPEELLYSNVMGICSPEELLYSDWLGMFSPKELLKAIDRTFFLQRNCLTSIEWAFVLQRNCFTAIEGAFVLQRNYFTATEWAFVLQRNCFLCWLHLWSLSGIMPSQNHPVIFFVCRYSLLFQNCTFFLSCLPLIISVCRRQENAHGMLHLPKCKTVMLTTLPAFTFLKFKENNHYRRTVLYIFCATVLHVQYSLPISCGEFLFVINCCSDMFWSQLLGILRELASLSTCSAYVSAYFREIYTSVSKYD